MNSERERHITSIFHSAIEREPHNREHFLDGACAGDASLRREVEALIKSHESAGSFIDSPVYERGARLLSPERGGALAGRSLGQYRLISLLGAGGMGEVYLAEDTRLDRRVAIKVLPANLTKDQTQVGRFQQEARAASALNHPNIVTIHEINEADGTRYIATEYIEGVTLRARLARGGLTLGEALELVVQIAAALNAAHSAGVVHRDIKPENVMLRPDGYVKVLDFGIAKLLERQRPALDSEAATRALVQTDRGVVMGTAHYMSPEQARGVPVDARTDIWSLGVLLYELVAGHVPFAGETASDSIASILKTEPRPLTVVAPTIPLRLEWIVQKALRKDRDERYQTAKELLSDLRAVKEEVNASTHAERFVSAGTQAPPSSANVIGTGLRDPAVGPDSGLSGGVATVGGASQTTSSAEYLATEIKRHKFAAVFVLVTLAVVGAGAVFALYKFGGRTKTTPPIFQNVDVSRITTSGRAQSADISPDGRFVVYLEMSDDGNRSIMVRQTATGNTLPLVPPSKGNVLKKTSFSRDGNFIYYLFSDRTKPEAIYRVTSIGGTPTKLIDNVASPAAVSPDDKRIAFVRWEDRKSKLLIAKADGTSERLVATLEGDRYFATDGLSWSPDGKTLALAAGATVGDEEEFRLLGIDVETGATKELSPHKWIMAGRVVWMPDGAALALIAQERVEEVRTQVWRVTYPAGEASRVTNDVQEHDQSTLGVTADGRTLVTVVSQSLSRIETVPASGDINRLAQLSIGEANQEGHDGIAQALDGRIVFSSFEGSQSDLWVMDRDGSNRKRLTSDNFWKGQPTVSPDGRYVVFASNRPIGGVSSRIWRIDIDGGHLLQLTTGYAFAPSVSPDGKWVAHNSVIPSEGTKLAKVSIDGGAPIRLTDYFAASPSYSPDGKWIACLTMDRVTEKWNYAVLPAAGGPPTRQFNFPAFQYQNVAWTPDSRYLSYIGTPPDPSNIWLQPVDGSEPHQLTNFKSDYIFHHAWAYDGRSLTLVRGRETDDVVLMKDMGESKRP